MNLRDVAHHGDPCIHCGTPHDLIEPGPCPTISKQPRYHYRREGLRYAVRAGTGTRVLFRVWRRRTALILCGELLCAYLDGRFIAREEYLNREGDPT